MILEKFADYPEHTKFDLLSPDLEKNIKKFSYEPELVHYHNYKFAVLVPHLFVDKTEGETYAFESYSYSFT